MANLTIAYILWFFLGIFGVHHFYLRRDRQAFVWWSTLGGFFCVGWVRDLWRLPEYVKECNEDQNVDVRDRNDNSFTVRSKGKPKVGFARFFGMMMMGIILGYLVQAACPKEVFNSPGIVGWICSMVIPPFAAAIGNFLIHCLSYMEIYSMCSLVSHMLTFPVCAELCIYSYIFLCNFI